MALLYRQLCDAILEEIQSGKLKPGDPVASELELARQFGVSRITSKRALDTLRQDGIVVRQRGRGTFVAKATSRPADPVPSTNPPRIGFVVPDMSDTFGIRMLAGIEEEARDRGYQLVLRRTQGVVETESRAIAEFVASGVNGLIVFPVHGEFYNAELLKHVIAGFPVVLVDRELPGIPVSSVSTDNATAARLLTNHLIEHGHTSLAFVSPPPNRTSSIEQRLSGFRQALAARALGVELTALTSTLPGVSIERDLEADRQRVLQFFALHPEVTGIVACECTMALLIELVLSEAGLPVPEIACFDSVHEPFDRFRFPYIRQDEHGIGVSAVQLLISHMDSPRQVQNLTIPHQLILPHAIPPAVRITHLESQPMARG
ncbi:MAG: GntR family transcriptional regulator [Thermomicrobiales bacterium]